MPLGPGEPLPDEVKWGCCPNDFKKVRTCDSRLCFRVLTSLQYLGLRPYKTFLEWNPNEEVAAVTEKLYGTIDHLELYADFQAGDTKPAVKGVGLCPGYTISRVILADATALTCGCRPFTADFTPPDLPTWGFADCMRSPENFGFSSMLCRLFLVLSLKSLPKQYLCPVPARDPRGHGRDFDKTGPEEVDFKRPGSTHGVREFKEYGEVPGILGNKEKFRRPFLNGVSKVLPCDRYARKEREGTKTDVQDIGGDPGTSRRHHQVLLRKHQESRRQAVVHAHGWREECLGYRQERLQGCADSVVATQVVSGTASSRGFCS